MPVALNTRLSRLGRCLLKNENCITSILNGETANSRVFYDTHTHSHMPTDTPKRLTPDAYASRVIKNYKAENSHRK